MKVADVKARYMGETKTTTVTHGRVVMDGVVIREGKECEATITHGEEYDAEVFVHDKRVWLKVNIPGGGSYGFVGDLRGRDDTGLLVFVLANRPEDVLFYCTPT